MLATRKQTWGEDRVMFFDEQGRLRSLPGSWTDMEPPDVRAPAAANRAFLRADDLMALSALHGEMMRQGNRTIRHQRLASVPVQIWPGCRKTADFANNPPVLLEDAPSRNSVNSFVH